MHYHDAALHRIAVLIDLVVPRAATSRQKWFAPPSLSTLCCK
jgi:hypothetical protein